MEKYQLYIGRYKELPEEKYTYYSAERGYMLVYTANDISIQGFKKVLVEKIKDLAAEEKDWLTITKTTINLNYLAENASIAAESLNKFLELFEDFIEREKNK